MNRAFDQARLAPDPLAAFDLDTLIDGAARLRPDRLALSDTFQSLTFREVGSRVCALAGRFRDLDLNPGETVLIAAAAPAASFIALAAALQSGLRAALAPIWADAAEARRMALLSGAAALILAPCEGFSASEQDWLAAAASSPAARVICSLGDQEIDGVVPLKCDPMGTPAAAPSPFIRRPPPRILTFEPGCVPVVHAQRTVIAAALDLASRARIGMTAPLLSTMPPASFAGLVAGPISSLIAGASLIWRLPFDAAAFLSVFDESGPVHLVLPAALAPALERAGAASADSLASLILAHRVAGWTVPELDPWRPGGDCVEGAFPIIDLYAFGERAAAPELRGPDGRPRPPAQQPHYLALDGARVLALDWSNDDGQRRLEGAAASEA